MSMFVNFITSNTFQSIAQNTDACVKIETALKAAGRPAFTLIDKNTDKETRKYSAAKELLYQLLCFGIYVAVIPPIFKTGGLKVFQKLLKREQLPAFKNAKEMLSYYHLAHLPLEERQGSKLWKHLREELLDPKTGKSLKNDYLLKMDKDSITQAGKMFKPLKGAIELSSIVGSVAGLTILAPEISHLILHPIMKVLGMEPHKKEAEPKTEQDTKQLDKQV